MTGLYLRFSISYGNKRANLYLGNRLLLTVLRMIDLESTNIQGEGTQLPTEFSKVSYLTADKLWFVKLECYGTNLRRK